jgi:hypothetical protein
MSVGQTYYTWIESLTPCCQAPSSIAKRRERHKNPTYHDPGPVPTLVKLVGPSSGFTMDNPAYD